MAAQLTSKKCLKSTTRPIEYIPVTVIYQGISLFDSLKLNWITWLPSMYERSAGNKSRMQYSHSLRTLSMTKKSHCTFTFFSEVNVSPPRAVIHACSDLVGVHWCLCLIHDDMFSRGRKKLLCIEFLKVGTFVCKDVDTCLKYFWAVWCQIMHVAI